jgi:hypothetical protein
MSREILQFLETWLPIATGFATLLALGLGLVQLRDVKRNIQLQSNLNVMQAERAIWALSLTDPHVAPTILRERWGENGRERLFAALLIDHFEALYFQHRKGAIPHANWAPLERAMLEHLSSPTLRAIWEQHKDLYWREFREFVEKRLAAAASR